MSISQSESYFAKLTKEEQEKHYQKKKIDRVIFFPGPTMQTDSYLTTLIKQRLHKYAFDSITEKVELNFREPGDDFVFLVCKGVPK